MLSAVIIVLREVLEASLIVSTLLVASRVFGLPNRWAPRAVFWGIVGAGVIARCLGAVSEWFEGTGQELLNAIMLTMITLALICISFCIAWCARRDKRPNDGQARAMQALLICAVTTAVVREGAEIVIYVYGFSFSGQSLVPVLLGGGIGLGIGISAGVLLFYGLINLPVRFRVTATPVLIAFVASGMSSEAVLYLIQAGWLPAQMPLWDTGRWVPEPSITGQLLYALLGYEATPTTLQVMAYSLTLLLILSIVIWGIVSKTPGGKTVGSLTY